MTGLQKHSPQAPWWIGGISFWHRNLCKFFSSDVQSWNPFAGVHLCVCVCVSVSLLMCICLCFCLHQCGLFPFSVKKTFGFSVCYRSNMRQVQSQFVLFVNDGTVEFWPSAKLWCKSILYSDNSRSLTVTHFATLSWKHSGFNKSLEPCPVCQTVFCLL